MLPKNLFAKRMSNAVPSKTMMIATLAKAMQDEGKKVADLSLGDPSLDPSMPVSQSVLDAGINAIKDRRYFYTSPAGLLDARKAVTEKLGKENELSYSPDEISITVGVKQGIFNCFASTIEEDDEIILPCPAWLSYSDIAAIFGGKTKFIETNIESNFKITPKQLEEAITPKTKWLVFVSPNNPTGVAYTEVEMVALGKVLEKYPDVMIMNDQIYEYLTYNEGFKFVSFAAVNPSLKDRTVTLGGCAKSHGLTGWRIGYAAGHKDIISKLNTLQSNETSSAPTMAQYALIAALKDGRTTADKYLPMLKKRKELLTKVFKESGIEPNHPDGAIYLFPCIKGLIGKSYKGKIIDSCITFCMLLLENESVALTPGLAFNSPNYFRLSLANSDESIEFAANGIKKFCSELK